MAVLLGSIKNDELIKKRNSLYIKALKMFPNSPAQLEVRKEIDKLNKKIK